MVPVQPNRKRFRVAQAAELTIDGVRLCSPRCPHHSLERAEEICKCAPLVTALARRS